MLVLLDGRSRKRLQARACFFQSFWLQSLGYSRLLEVIGGRVGKLGKVTVGDVAEFGADDVGRQTRAQKAAIERCDFTLVERAAEMREAAFYAHANQSGFVRFSEDGFEGRVDVAVRNTAGAKFAGDAEAALAAQFRVLAGVIERVASII